MSGPSLFINPNSSAVVTDGIRGVLSAMRLANGPEFEVIDIPESLATIATTTFGNVTDNIIIQYLELHSKRDATGISR